MENPIFVWEENMRNKKYPPPQTLLQLRMAMELGEIRAE